MTAVLFGSIQTGSTIQIKRSDGRVHAAKVVQLSPDSKSIGVEWSENGEIKGKEILVDAVFELNTQLRPVPTRFTLDIESIEREVPARPPSQLLTKFTPTPGTNPKVRSSSAASTSRRPLSSVLVHQPTISLPSPSGPFGQMIVDYRSKLNFTPLSNANVHQRQFEAKDLRICVAVRKRPMNKRELAKKENDVVTIPTRDQCVVHVPKTKVDLTKYLEHQNFKFDYTFDERVSTELVYRYTAAALIETIFQGGNATVFAYGQTGSGKTFTMGGDDNSSTGIYVQTARDLFSRLSSTSSVDVFVTFYEIYCGKVFDLMNNKKRLRVLEDHQGLVQVCDRKEQPVTSVEDVLKIIQDGMNIRTSGSTAANASSSRSHAILQLILRTSGTRRTTSEIGKMSLIDLAGSERGKDTANGDRLQRMEGSEINKSLLALKECIRALGRGDGTHVPFRGSTLTKVLRDSFIGEKSKVCMIAMVSPAHADVENTMNTLRYADRVKELQSEGPTDSLPDDEEEVEEEEESLLDICEDLLLNKDPLFTDQLRSLIEQSTMNDGDTEIFTHQIREHLRQRQLALNEVQQRLQALR